MRYTPDGSAPTEGQGIALATVLGSAGRSARAADGYRRFGCAMSRDNPTKAKTAVAPAGAFFGPPVAIRAPSVAILEPARFALMRHFLRPEQLLSRQALGDEVPVSGRQRGVLIAGNCRGEVLPHVGAHAVFCYSAPLLVHDA